MHVLNTLAEIGWVATLLFAFGTGFKLGRASKIKHY